MFFKGLFIAALLFTSSAGAVNPVSKCTGKAFSDFLQQENLNSHGKPKKEEVKKEDPTAPPPRRVQGQDILDISPEVLERSRRENGVDP